MAKLLVLDNDVRIVELVTMFLRQAGHVVRTANSFREARARLAEEMPELLLSDLELGAESGREELPALWRAGVLPPTLVVSGYVDAELERELANVPAIVGILRKPFDFARLAETIERALADARARRLEIEHARRTRDVNDPRAQVVSEPDDDGWVEIRAPDSSRGAHA